MNGWQLLEVVAWALSAVVAVWLLRDAYRTGRDHDEDFLVHTMEDLGEESDWQQSADAPASDDRRTS